MVGDTTNEGKAADQQKSTAAPPKDQEANDAGSKSAAKSHAGRLKRLLTVNVLIILVVGSLIVHGAGLAYSHLAGRRAGSVDAEAEISLGPYVFEADPSERSRVAGAEFALHIALIEDVERQARRVLARRKNRVKQDVEELLRQAHGGDFVDPTLGELKRRLQERINETLGIRAIADVIITDLEVRRKAREPKLSDETAGSVPWVEEPAG